MMAQPHRTAKCSNSGGHNFICFAYLRHLFRRAARCGELTWSRDEVGVIPDESVTWRIRDRILKFQDIGGTTLALLCGGLLAGALAFHGLVPLPSDVSYFIAADGRILNGAVPYADIMETNPPLAFWITLPAVWLARVLGLPPHIAYVGYVCLAIAGALGLTRLVLQSAGETRENTAIVLLASAAALTLAVPLAQWARLSMATSSLDAQGAAIAAKALGEVSASEDAIDRLQDQLADQRGGGAGFLPTLGVVTAAMESMPNVELSALSFDPDGTLRATLRAGRQAEIEIVRRAIETRGFSVTQGMPGNGQARAEIELQVRPG
mgnify:CR=1 FL=1